jgi:hypothetical protein
MAMDIRQAFLHYAKQSRLYFRLEPAQRERNLHLHGYSAALCETFRIPHQRRLQSDFVEQWRVQQVGHRARFRDRVFNLFDGVRQEFAHAHLRFGRRLHGDDVQVHFYGHQILTEAIVEFASNASPLFVLALHEPAG